MTENCCGLFYAYLNLGILINPDVNFVRQEIFDDENLK